MARSTKGPVSARRRPVGGGDEREARPRHRRRSEPERAPEEDERAGEHERVLDLGDRDRDAGDREDQEHRFDVAAPQVGRGRARQEGECRGRDQYHARADRDRERPGRAPEFRDARLAVDRDRQGEQRGAEHAADGGGGDQRAQLAHANETERSARVPTQQHRGGKSSRGDRDRVTDDELDRGVVPHRRPADRERAGDEWCGPHARC